MKKSNTAGSQKKTETALKESEQRYRTTMMSVGDGVIATDTEGRVEMMNPVAEELTGWKEREARGKLLEKIFAIVNEETRKTVENPVHRVMREGAVVGLANHTVLIARDGTEHPIADSGAPIRNEKGDIAGMVLVFRDQTQERTAQKVLQESEAKYKSLFENAQVGMYRSKIDGSAFLGVNNKCAEIFGFTREELLGAPANIRWTNIESRDKMMRLIKEQGGILNNYEVSVLDKNGEVRDLIASIELHTNEGYLDGTMIDITNRKWAEEALVASEVRYRSYIEATGQIGWVTNADGEVVEDVPSLRKFSGQTYDEAKGSGWAKTLHPDDLERSLQVWNKAVAKKSSYEIEYRMRRHDGVYRYLLARGFPVFREDGSIREWVGTCIDITERKVSEEVIKDNEKRFRELIESLPQLFWTCLVDGPCDYLSKQWVEYTGIPESEQLGYRWLEQLHPDDKDRTVSDWMEKVKTGASFDIELRIRRNDGEYRWFKTRAVPMRNAEGNIIKWFGSNTDFNEIKKTKEHLRKLNRVYSLLSDINQAIVRTRVPQELFEKVCEIAVGQGGFGMAWIGLIDESSQKLQMIAQAGRTSGYHEKVNISLSSEPLTHCPVDSALRNGKHSICNIIEKKGMAPCQKVAYDLGFRSSASFPLKVSDILRGALTFYSDEPDFFDEEELKLLDELAMDISFAMDYAEKEAGRKKAEEALRGSEAKYRTLVENIPQGIFMKDRNYKWVSINENFARNLGVRPKDIEGKSDRDLFPIDIADKYHADDMRIMEKGQTEEFEEESILDGKHVWVNTIKTPVRDKNGEIVGLLGIFWDITQRKQAEEEIQKLNTELEDRVIIRTAELEASNKELEAFSYSVSHDLRAPLRHVSGYVELLNKQFQSEISEKGQHYLNSIADSVRLMGVLIDDLLRFSRTGRIEMVRAVLDMNEIVHEVKESISKENPGRRIEWVLGKLPSINGDYAMLQLVWLNLLNNAVKFTGTKNNARIEVGANEEKKEWIFFVHDNGVGFDMKYAHKLFGVFQRLHPVDEFEGTGIGLANVRRIVSRHGGRTWAEAKPEEGAEFYFSLPKK